MDMDFKKSSRIGFIGLGAMGAGMAQCLLNQGYAVDVYELRADVMQEFKDAGAIAHLTARDLGAHVDLVFLSLPDGAAVESALFGANGLSEGLRPGTCVVDTSTISTQAAQHIGQRLATQGVAFMDAPVSGGQQGAASGTLTCMVGGSVDSFEKCKGALSAFCSSITHVGNIGAGQTVKACNQVAVAGAMLGVSDAIALAKSQGVDLNVMRGVLLGGAARSFSMEKHAPRIIEQNFAPGFRARLMRKDLRLALETANASNTPLSTAAVAEALLDAMCESGNGDLDWSAVAVEAQRRAPSQCKSASGL